MLVETIPRALNLWVAYISLGIKKVLDVKLFVK